VTAPRPITVLCLSSYEKGHEFLRECRRQGARVLLLTVEKLADAAWPRESLDDVLLMPSLANREHVVNAVSYLARTQRIDRIVALDDYDVETAASVREHLRVPGMGDTTARYFRDKLAMRVKAREHGILVPDFCPAINHEDLLEYMESVPPPWVLKPRDEASAIGIRKVSAQNEVWGLLEALGDRQSHHVLEKYVPGSIYHVDSVVSEREVVFAAVHRYGHPPMNVAHDGGVFTSRTVRTSLEEGALQALNRELLGHFGFVRGVTHTEFIKSDQDGRFYFLETAARVGGANIAELVEAATGVNLWAEWAKIELSRGQSPYALGAPCEDYAGIIISLARQEEPDTSEYHDPEIVWRLRKRHHVGLIVSSPDSSRVEELLDDYTHRFYEDFWATQPLPDKPSS
jgi:biotin carboxylase